MAWESQRGARQRRARNQNRNACMGFFHLRGRFIRAVNGFLRRFFPFGPNRAPGEIFLLPDRDRALQRVNRVAASFESLPAMRGTHSDQNARLANFKPAEPVKNREAMNRDSFAYLRADL